MKTILSFIVLAMAVLVMGCGEPASTTPVAEDGVSANSDAGASCSCCKSCDKCEDGAKCECTAKSDEECDCKCASKDGDTEMVSAKGDEAEEGSGHKEDGHDHE